MLIATGQPIRFEAPYTAGGLAKTGLTVTVDVQRNGTSIVTDAPATPAQNGVYVYILAGTSTTVEGSYVATFKTADTTVDQRHMQSYFTTQSWVQLIAQYIDAAISSRLAALGYTAPPTVAAIRSEMDSNSTKLANLDATVSSRSTYAGGDTSGTTTLLSRLTPQRAENLDNLDIPVSDVSAAGNGIYELTINVVDHDANAVQGAWVELQGTGLRQSTDTLGTVAFHVNDGEYSAIVLSNSRYEEAAPVEITVDGEAVTASIELTAITIEPSTIVGRVNIEFSSGVFGPSKAGTIYTLFMDAKPPVMIGGRWEDDFKWVLKTDANGSILFQDIPSAATLRAGGLTDTYSLKGPGVEMIKIRPETTGRFENFIVTQIP